MTRALATPTAFFFDLDGTLLDTAPDLAAAVNYARRTLLSLPPLPHEQLRTAVTRGTQALIATGGGLTIDDRLFNTFRDTMLGYYQEHVADLSKPFAGISDLLSYLDQMQIDWGVITNKPQAYAEPLCQAMGYNTRAVCLVSGDTTKQAKPHPAHLLLAAKQTGHNPEKCVYLGDAATDMMASRRAGMYGVAATWGYIEPDEDISCWPADKTISHPNELIAWIKSF